MEWRTPDGQDCSYQARARESRETEELADWSLFNISAIVERQPMSAYVNVTVVYSSETENLPGMIRTSSKLAENREPPGSQVLGVGLGNWVKDAGIPVSGRAEWNSIVLRSLSSPSGPCVVRASRSLYVFPVPLTWNSASTFLLLKACTAYSASDLPLSSLHWWSVNPGLTYTRQVSYHWGTPSAHSQFRFPLMKISQFQINTRLCFCKPLVTNLLWCNFFFCSFCILSPLNMFFWFCLFVDRVSWSPR